MGCGDSRPAAGRASVKGPLTTRELTLPTSLNHFLPTTGPLSPEDYRGRVFSTDGTQTVRFPFSGMTFKYALVSQRGFYPESPDKPNQDAVCAYQNFGNDPEQLFFGVFDGHGNYGTSTAQFAKDKVPGNLMIDGAFLSAPDMAYTNAMCLTNTQLHMSPIDDSMSGTTAITALIRGRKMYVANVGDSRGVLGEMRGDQLVAVPLSQDQTPFRRDEVARVRKEGARVMTLDQMEGLKDPTTDCWDTEDKDGADPPRLWMPTAMFPGTAFTRSIGDSAAERIGVIAEPEIVMRLLQPGMRIVVLASDGVFEFLKNQAVIDLVSKYEEPQEAAIALVVEAYRQWLANEVRTDDITAIVIFIEYDSEKPTAG